MLFGLGDINQHEDKIHMQSSSILPARSCVLLTSNTKLKSWCIMFTGMNEDTFGQDFLDPVLFGLNQWSTLCGRLAILIITLNEPRTCIGASW